MLCVIFLAALTVAAQMRPFPTPSVAQMERQSGTIPAEWVDKYKAAYEKHGCTSIGVTRIDDRNFNVWCVRVELFDK